MCYKLKYSSLFSFKKKKNSILHIKGPLGTNLIQVPSNIKFSIDSYNQIIIFSSISLKFEKKKNFRGFLSIFYNSCRTLVFGDLIGLNIKGLGLKFLKINKNYLVMNLGYADSVNFFIDCNRSIFFFKDIRNISIYSTDYCFLRNQIFTLVGLKKPNKFRKRENGITVSSQIV